MMAKEGYNEIKVGLNKVTLLNDWIMYSLEELIDLKNGKFNPTRNLSDCYEIPVYGGNGITGFFHEELIEQPTIVIGRVGEYCGSIHLTKGKSWITDNAIYVDKIKTKDLVDLIFLSIYLNFLNLNKLSNKTGQPKLTQSRILSLKIPLPPLPEQKKIASILSSVDNAIEKTETIIKEAKKLKKGLMQHLLTKGIGHDEFTKFPNVGIFPKEWSVKGLGECAHINRKNLSIKTDPDYLIEYIDISSIDQTGVISKTTEFAFKDAPSRAKRKVTIGDVIISTVRPYLKAFALIKEQKENLICSTGYAVLTPKRLIDSTFLYYYVCSDRFVNYLERLMRGTNYPAVNTLDVKIAPIIVPPLEEQKRIAKILSSVDNKILKEQEYKDALETLKKGLMQKLLTGEVRVKVDEEAS